MQCGKSLLGKGGVLFFPALLPPCRQGYGNMTSPPAPTLNHEVVLATGALPGGLRCWTICFQTLHKKETFCFFEPLLFSAFGDWQPILILSIRLANSKSLDAPSSVKPKPNLPSLERTAERRAWCEKVKHCMRMLAIVRERRPASIAFTVHERPCPLPLLVSRFSSTSALPSRQMASVRSTQCAPPTPVSRSLTHSFSSSFLLPLSSSFSISST